MITYVIAQAAGVMPPEQLEKFKVDLLRVAMEETSDIEVAINHVDRRFKEIKPRANRKRQKSLRREHEQNKKRDAACMNGHRRNHGHANGYMLNPRLRIQSTGLYTDPRSID